MEMCNPSLDGSKQTEKAKHIDAMARPFNQPHRPTRKALYPRCGQDRIEMAVLKPLAISLGSGLADQTNVPAPSFHGAREREIIGGCKVAGIDKHDSF